MSAVTGYSSIAGTDATLESVRGASKAKGNSDKHRNTGFSEEQDSVSISEKARNKHAASVSGGEDGSVVVTGNDENGYKNETHALKAALRQLSEESGTPIRGWGLGHYRKAFREDTEGDLSAVRDIFYARHGIQKAPAAEEPGSGPVDDVDSGLEELPGDAGTPGDELAGAGGDSDDAAPSGGEENGVTDAEDSLADTELGDLVGEPDDLLAELTEQL